MVSSTHQRGWLSTTRTIFLLRIGATRGFRYFGGNIVTEYFNHGRNVFKTFFTNIDSWWFRADPKHFILPSWVYANALTNALARFSTSLVVSSPTWTHPGAHFMDHRYCHWLLCVQPLKTPSLSLWPCCLSVYIQSLYNDCLQGIGLTPDGNIVVADSGNHCLKIYKYLQ